MTNRASTPLAPAPAPADSEPLVPILGDDPTQAIRQVFESRDSGKLCGNEDALAGLKRLSADYIINRL